MSLKQVMPVLILILAARAEASDGAPLDEYRTQTEVGLGAGAIMTPTFSSRNPLFFGGVATLEVDVPMERLGFHLSALLGGGTAPSSSGDRAFGLRARGGESVALGAFLLDMQLRLAFTPTISSGVGALLGLAVGEVGESTGLGFWFGPSLMPFAVRLAEQHELSLWLGLALLSGPEGVGLGGFLPSLRYAYYF